jgi:hypothetical protein
MTLLQVVCSTTEVVLFLNVLKMLPNVVCVLELLKGTSVDQLEAM